MNDPLRATRQSVLRVAGRASRAGFEAKYPHFWLVRLLLADERRSIGQLAVVPDSSGPHPKPHAPAVSVSALPARRTLNLHIIGLPGLLSLLRQDPELVGFHAIAKGESRLWSERILIGRAQNNDIVIRHEGISKLHAWFECRPTHIEIFDAKSANGTWVGTSRLAPPASAKVVSGTFIRFGRVVGAVVDSGTLHDELRQLDIRSAGSAPVVRR